MAKGTAPLPADVLNDPTPSTGKNLGGNHSASAPRPDPIQEQNNSDLVSFFQNGFSDQTYANSPAFQEILKNFSSDPGRTLIDKSTSGTWQNLLKGYGDTFAKEFQNKAGRAPTADEYNTFFQQVVVPMQPWNKTPDQLAIAQGSTDVINRNLSSAVADAAQQKAQQQADAATAPGSAFDTWQKGYTDSLNGVEKSLQDYQSRLFEKIRPQLLTSLQSQGLLDTGGLNEAFAGAASDLTSGTENYMAQARAGAAQDIASRKFDIQQAPTNFALQNTFSQVPNLTQSGQTALQNLWGQSSATNLANLNFQNQGTLLDRELNAQPSYLQQIGGTIVGGLAGGFGRKLAGG